MDFSEVRKHAEKLFRDRRSELAERVGQKSLEIKDKTPVGVAIPHSSTGEPLVMSDTRTVVFRTTPAETPTLPTSTTNTLPSSTDNHYHAPNHVHTTPQMPSQPQDFSRSRVRQRVITFNVPEEYLAPRPRRRRTSPVRFVRLV